MRAKITILTMLLGGLVSCGSDNFPKFAALGQLRVLTITALANQSEVNPGTTVTLQPVISDLNGGGRTLNVTVVTCVDPGISFGAPASCAHPDSTTTSSFAGSTLGANNTYTGTAPTFTVNVPNLPLVSASDKFNGVGYLVLYTIASADGSAVVTAFKRIVVTDPSKAAKNLNPTIAAVSDNGATLVASNAYSGAVQDLTPTYTVTPETYQTMNPDGSFTTHTEFYSSTWFYTDGTMKFPHTSNADENQWTPARTAGRGTALVLVTHDGRGGEDFQVFQFN